VELEDDDWAQNEAQSEAQNDPDDDEFGDDGQYFEVYDYLE